MIGQMKYTMIEDSNIVSAVEKLAPAASVMGKNFE